jgi:NADPH-dependent curcumin reductase CurA
MSTAVTSREVRLIARPRGWPAPSDFQLVETTLPAPRDGEVLVRNVFMSVDPYMRGRMNDAKSYAPPYALGAAMHGGAIGRVVESRAPSLPVGTVVRSSLGWREAFVATPKGLEVIDPQGYPLSWFLGVLGMPGMTAYVGLFDIAQARPGETVFVSAASGAVGSVAGQLAKLHGCRVVGSVGSPEKARFLREELGFDAAFDYHDGDLPGALARAAPGGVDVYFENVGGEHLQAALGAMNDFGRIALCGMIADYNEPTPGPNNLYLMVGKRITMRGFIVLDHAARTPDFVREVGGYVASGKLVARETVVDGIENALGALLDVLRGGRHVGKMVVRLGPDAA